MWTVLAKRPRAVRALATRSPGAGVDHALHDDMRRGKPVLERYGDADELIPLLDDEGEIDRVAGQRSSGP
jgi:hypothetical protein